MYSNSKTDTEHSAESCLSDEGAVRNMYEVAPYPGLGANLKDMGLYLNPLRDFLNGRQNLHFLDVGCGTGHILVGVAKSNPQWSCHGIDLSSASLEVAQDLANMHGAEVTLERGSYLDPLPYSEDFDVISAIGTIHHCADPVAALRNIAGHLKDDGYILLHMYGLRCDREKFDAKEVLDILEPDLGKHDTRFDLYRGLEDHKNRDWLRRLARTSPADIVRLVRNKWRDISRTYRKISWSPSFREDYKEASAPWIDHFCHPCERAYDVPEIRELVEAAGLEVTHMLNQGREDLKLIPPDWQTRYQDLDQWQKWRLSELLSPGGRSFALILRQKKA